jgi:hypothetical protein
MAVVPGHLFCYIGDRSEVWREKPENVPENLDRAGSESQASYDSHPDELAAAQ